MPWSVLTKVSLDLAHEWVQGHPSWCRGEDESPAMRFPPIPQRESALQGCIQLRLEGWRGSQGYHTIGDESLVSSLRQAPKAACLRDLGLSCSPC